MKLILALSIITGSFLFSFSASAQTFEGNWYGILSTDFGRLPLVYHIQKVKKNKFSATLDSPQQKSFGNKADLVKVKNDSIVITFKNISAEYRGKLAREGLNGSFNQFGAKYPMNLSLDSSVIAPPKRPQKPVGPFPYNIKDVTFNNSIDHLSLSGTLTYPKDGTKFKAVVLITGSGAQNRNEEMLGHEPFWVISDYLTRHGIAVLRYDDRGTGKSKGNFAQSTTYDFKNDAQAAIDFLKMQPFIDSNQVGVIGHSEGGMIAGMLAAQPNNIHFAVFLAAPGVAIKDLMIQQNKDIMSSDNKYSEAAMDSAVFLVEKLYDALIQQDSCGVNCLSAIIKKNIGEEQYQKEMMRYFGMLQMLNSHWFRAFIKIKPDTYLKDIAIPILALNGDKDIQVKGVDNLEAIKNAIPNNHSLKEILYPGLNHLFQPCIKCTISEYGEIETTFSEKAMEDIANWIINLK